MEGHVETLSDIVNIRRYGGHVEPLSDILNARRYGGTCGSLVRHSEC